MALLILQLILTGVIVIAVAKFFIMLEGESHG